MTPEPNSPLVGDLNTLLAGLQPSLRPGVFLFAPSRPTFCHRV